jgi:hypothetical protein
MQKRLRLEAENLVRAPSRSAKGNRPVRRLRRMRREVVMRRSAYRKVEKSAPIRLRPRTGARYRGRTAADAVTPPACLGTTDVRTRSLKRYSRRGTPASILCRSVFAKDPRRGTAHIR